MSDNQNHEEGARTPEPRENARRLLKIVALVLAAWFLSRGIIGLLVPPVEQHPAQQRQMSVAAHRGGSALFPENTMYAFRRSAEMGVDILEMDLRLTQDKRIVVIHDETVFRTTNGEGRVEDLTLSQLRRLDAAYWWPYGQKEDCEVCSQIPEEEFIYRDQGIQIPLLEEVLAEFPNIMKILEIKPIDGEMVGILGELLREYDQAENAVIASFHSENLKSFRDQFPEFATSAAQSEATAFVILNYLGFGSSYPSPAEFFQVPVSSGVLPVITKSFLQTAAENNIRVHAWTINERAEMTRLLDMGIDGIITDDPAELLDLLGR